MFRDNSVARYVICVDAVGADDDALVTTLDSVARSKGSDATVIVVSERIIPFGVTPRGTPCLVDGDARLLSRLRSAALASGSTDVLLVGAGVQVPPRWDVRLLACAARNASIGSVSPLCDEHPLFASGGPKRVGSLADVDRMIQGLGTTEPIQTPYFFPGCAYLSGAALKSLQAEDVTDVVTLAQAIEGAGFFNVIAPNVLVADPIPERHYVYTQAASGFDGAAMLGAEPIRTRRQIVHDVLKNGVASSTTRPVQLHIAHGLAGGTGRWIQDFCRSDLTRANLVLKSSGSPNVVGERLVLSRDYESTEPLRAWNLSTPIRSTAIAHHEYQRILARIIREQGVGVVVVSSLIGHSLDALGTGLQTLLVTHDVYPFCARLFGFFDEPCQSCDRQRLRTCITENPLPDPNPFVDVPAEHWEALRRHFISRVRDFDVKLISPSAAAASRWKTLMPELGSRHFSVIEHGVSLTRGSVEPPPTGQKLRVAVLGTVAPHKGLALLQHAVDELRDEVDFVFLGCGPKGEGFRGRPNVRVVSEYLPENLFGLLVDARPDLGLVPSTVPETFSYTLSEFMHFGVAPLVTRMGSLASRVSDGVNGFVCEPTAGSVVACLRQLATDRASIERIRSALSRSSSRTALDMVSDYHSLAPDPPVPLLTADVHLDPGSAGKSGWLDPNLSIRAGVAAFYRYLLCKIERSPRLSPRQRRGLLALLPRVRRPRSRVWP